MGKVMITTKGDVIEKLHGDSIAYDKGVRAGWVVEYVGGKLIPGPKHEKIGKINEKLKEELDKHTDYQTSNKWSYTVVFRDVLKREEGDRQKTKFTEGDKVDWR